MDMVQCFAGENCSSLKNGTMCIYIHPGEDVNTKRKMVEEFISKQRKELVKSGMMRPRRSRKPSEKKAAMEKEELNNLSNKKLPRCGVCEAAVRPDHPQITCVQCRIVLHLICSGLEQRISGYYCMDCMGDELELSRTLERSIQLSDDSDESVSNDGEFSSIQFIIPKTARIENSLDSTTDKDENIPNSHGVDLPSKTKGNKKTEEEIKGNTLKESLDIEPAATNDDEDKCQLEEFDLDQAMEERQKSDLADKCSEDEVNLEANLITPPLDHPETTIKSTEKEGHAEEPNSNGCTPPPEDHNASSMSNQNTSSDIPSHYDVDSPCDSTNELDVEIEDSEETYDTSSESENSEEENSEEEYPNTQHPNPDLELSEEHERNRADTAIEFEQYIGGYSGESASTIPTPE